MKTTTIDLLRHGEVQGERRYRGSTDHPLTDKGWRQMQQQTANQRWDAIISSPLIRCQEFALQLSQDRAVPLYLDAAWQEIDFGDWENKTAEQINLQDPLTLARYYGDPHSHAPPNGEPHSDFNLRIANAWQDLLTQYTGQQLLVITHAGVIRSLFSLLLEISFKNSLHIEIGHASLSRFKCYHDGSSHFTQLNFHRPL